MNDETPPHDPVLPPAGPSPESIRRQNLAAVIGLMLVLAVLAFGAGFAVGRGTAPAGAAVAPTPGRSGQPDVATPTPAASALPADGPRLGLADAPVTLVVWADYQCPFCRRFAEEIMPALEPRIADGTLALVHRDYAFLGEESVQAAMATRCADREGRFWAMHDAVYAGQQGENQGAFALPRLEQMAALIGLDAAAFSACMDEREPLVRVLDDTAAGNRAGVSSTPTIDINGRRFQGVSDPASLLAAVDAAAAGQSPAPAPTAPPLPDPWAGVAIDGRTAGAPNAPVTVELWTDYQSPDSAVVAGDLEPELLTRIEAGSIRVILRDFATLGEESVMAAAMVRCTDAQGGPAWFVHDVLASNASGQGSGLYVPDNLLRFAARIGLDVAALSDCLDDPSVASEVGDETAIGQAGGLSTPPAVLVLRGATEVSRFSGAIAANEVLEAIDEAIGAAG